VEQNQNPWLLRIHPNMVGCEVPGRPKSRSLGATVHRLLNLDLCLSMRRLWGLSVRFPLFRVRSLSMRRVRGLSLLRLKVSGDWTSDTCCSCRLRPRISKMMRINRIKGNPSMTSLRLSFFVARITILVDEWGLQACLVKLRFVPQLLVLDLSGEYSC
jgi:hypothetical protein